MKRQKPVPSASFYVTFVFAILHVVAVDFLASGILTLWQIQKHLSINLAKVSGLINLFHTMLL